MNAAKSWSLLTDCLAEAGNEIAARCEGDKRAEAEGCRFVSRLFASMRLFLLEQDPRKPDFVPVMSPHRKFFADNPDTLYHRAPIRHDLTYRVTGNRGTCAYLSFCAYAVSDKGTRIVSDLSDDRLETDENGDFEIVLSSERPPGVKNWMAMDPEIRSLVTRQYFLDRTTETKASYEIEVCDSGVGSGREPNLTARIVALRDSFRRSMAATLKAGDAWMQKPNAISFESNAEGVVDLFPTPDNQYAGGWFQLEPGEVLVVEIEPPDCRYWSVHLLSRWLESLDGEDGPISINKSQAILSADGTACFVIGGPDSDAPNRLDTGGRPGGFFVFRWMQCEDPPPPPKCEVVTPGKQ